MFVFEFQYFFTKKLLNLSDYIDKYITESIGKLRECMMLYPEMLNRYSNRLSPIDLGPCRGCDRNTSHKCFLLAYHYVGVISDLPYITQNFVMLNSDICDL